MARLTVGQNRSLEPVRLGELMVDRVSFDDAVERILARVDSGAGGYAVTPNVHHICVADVDRRFRDASHGAFLSLADGSPLLWMSRALGMPIPEKVSGSDLILPLLRKAGARGHRVFLLGADEATCTRAIAVLGVECPGLGVAGHASPIYDPCGANPALDAVFDSIDALRPELLLVAMSCPKQEYLLAAYEARYSPAVAIGIGAGLDFLAGNVRRAPAWISRAGFEWLYRLVQEPARLWRRYLVDDVAILRIFVRSRRSVREAQADRPA